MKKLISFIIAVLFTGFVFAQEQTVQEPKTQPQNQPQTEPVAQPEEKANVNEMLIKKVEELEQKMQAMEAKNAYENQAAGEEKMKNPIPEWIKKVELKGDFRLRYQMQMDKARPEGDSESDTLDRDRLRYRARFGIGAKVNDWVKLNFGLASGSNTTTITTAMLTSGKDIKETLGGDQRSTNQTMEGFFSKKPVWIDYAYGEITPYKGISLIGGKMKNPIYSTDQLLWKSDITPEGGAIAINYPFLGDMISLIFNGGVFMLDEVKTAKWPDGGLRRYNDPFMVFAQLGAGFKYSDFDAKIAAAYYNPIHLDYEYIVPTTAITEEAKAMSGYALKKIDFNALNINYEANYALPGNYQIGAFGEFVMNISDNHRDVNGDLADEKFAYLIGLKGGSKAVKDLGDFEVKALYRQFQAIAWMPIFTDSDAFEGKPNTQSFKLAATAGLLKDFSIGLNYYYSTTLKTDYNKGKNSAGASVGIMEKENLVQIEANAKF